MLVILNCEGNIALTGCKSQGHTWYLQDHLGKLFLADNAHSPHDNAIGEDIYHEDDYQFSRR